MAERTPTKIQIALARNMKAYRAALGYSQARLAELADLSVPFVGDIEICRKTPSLQALESLAKALSLEPWQLIWDGKAFPSFAGPAIADRLVEEVTTLIRERFQSYPGGSNLSDGNPPSPEDEGR